tara:strand:- start:526 stop:1029 length:504 start_codon:yes stop_codon:yes gene_type:complete
MKSIYKLIHWINSKSGIIDKFIKGYKEHDESIKSEDRLNNITRAWALEQRESNRELGNLLRQATRIVSEDEERIEIEPTQHRHISRAANINRMFNWDNALRGQSSDVIAVDEASFIPEHVFNERSMISTPADRTATVDAKRLHWKTNDIRWIGFTYKNETIINVEEW